MFHSGGSIAFRAEQFWQYMFPQNRQWCRRSINESNATVHARPMHRSVVLSSTHGGGADAHGRCPSGGTSNPLSGDSIACVDDDAPATLPAPLPGGATDSCSDPRPRRGP
mmetsp:Transcript_19323/g.60790  ORF Transcript_19323/g.60790 Transcript_19323/m.60790 type:complete len:110 (+) Transcript_19323:929-1258(+)